MISIYLNQKKQCVHPKTSIYEVLVQEHLMQEHMAIALNNQLVPRGQWTQVVVQEGDSMDVIVPMQGG